MNRRGTRRRVWLLRTPSGTIGTVLLGFLVLAAIIGPIVANAEASYIDVAAAGQTPSSSHLLGTNVLGQDILSRVLVASRLSLELALAATAIGTILGLLIGALPSLFGRLVGRMVDGFIHVTVAFPGLLLVLFLAVIFGVSTGGAVLAVGLSSVPYVARLARSLFRSVENREFVAAARISGARRTQVLTRHILPNIAEPLIVNTAMGAGGAVLAFAGLSFLGIGIQAPLYDWGALLHTGQSQLYTNPAAILGPGVAIIAAGLAFNLIGDAAARHLSSDTASVKPERVNRADAVTHDAAPISNNTSSDDGPILSTRNLQVSYRSRGRTIRALRGVDLDVQRGEAVGVVGESGSGKSTIGLAIAGLIGPSGSVTSDGLAFGGQDLSTTTRRARNALLGLDLAVVFQDPMAALNPVRRLGRQLTDGIRYHRRLRRREANRLLEDRFDRVGIPDPASRIRQYPHQFSGGMRQRAVLAMGLLGTPSLIVADEPTTALDVTTERRVLAMLRSVCDEQSAALLIISHDMTVIRRTTDRVLVVYAGRVVEEVPTSNLASRAAHPYTRALLAVAPNIDGDRSKPLAVIPGRVPDPSIDIVGCSFAPRCPIATDRCSSQAPQLSQIQGDHRVACWNHDSVPERPKLKAGYQIG